MEENIFKDYARYYDLLNKDKNYSDEVDYVHQLIHKHRQSSRSILDLGCGTGLHAILLAEKEYTVHGIDQSQDMLERAILRKENLPKDISDRLSFEKGDVCDYRSDKRYDVAISLFHVMSYQTTNENLMAAFKTAKIHLKKDGLFIFDFWYGPAVLTDRPSVRIKRMEDDNIQVTRIAEPEIHANENIVDIHYHMFIKNKSTGIVEELRETHRTRYLFKPEIDLLFEQAGFEFVDGLEWMTGCTPGFDTWGVCFVGKR